MRTRIALLSLLTIISVLLAVAPASASVVYTNGPINGNILGYDIEQFFTSNSFTVPSAASPITGLHIGVWMYPGDSFSSVDMSIGSMPFWHNYEWDDFLTLTSFTDLGLNQYGYDIQQIDFTLPFSVYLPPSQTLWLTLSYAFDKYETQVFRNENDGPSSAFNDGVVGPIGSEAFWLTSPDVVNAHP